MLNDSSLKMGLRLSFLKEKNNQTTRIAHLQEILFYEDVETQIPFTWNTQCCRLFVFFVVFFFFFFCERNTRGKKQKSKASTPTQVTKTMEEKKKKKKKKEKKTVGSRLCITSRARETWQSFLFLFSFRSFANYLNL